MKRPIGFALLLLLAAGVSYGANADRVPTRFDTHVKYRVGGSIGLEVKPIESLSPVDALALGWNDFRANYGGRWRVLVDERSAMPTLVTGPGIELFANGQVPDSLDAVETKAREFIRRNKSVLGDWRGTLALDLAASGRISADHWQLIFRQTRDGVRVENARLDMHVKLGRLVMFGASYWGPVETSGIPTLDIAAARGVLDDYLGEATTALDSYAQPELTLIAVEAGARTHEPTQWTGQRGRGIDHTLVWRFQFGERGSPAHWVGEVDAHEGLVRTFYDGSHSASVRGGVFPISADGDCADDGCEVVGFPMPFADFTESGQAEQFSDAFGNLACVDSMQSYEVNLSGPYVNIEDECGAMTEVDACTDDMDLGLKFGENCDVDPNGSAGNSAAARTSYYHINRVAEIARFYDTTSAWLSNPLTVRVNQSGSCNAFWSNGMVRMLQKGSNCNNTGELSGVLVHEWGHGYDFNDGGGEDVPSEAYADIVTILYNRDSCISRGWYNDGTTCTGYGDTCLTCTGIRDHDWAARINNTPATPEGFTIPNCPSGPGGPCGREAHCEAYPIGETIFDLATRDLPAAGLDPDTAWQLTERLWYSTRLGGGDNIFDCFRYWLTHSCFAVSWKQRMLVADDDDGDLSNGTPHAAAIFAAFDRHDISCGNAGDPENQSTSSCATLTTPSLSLMEMPGTGTQLNWPAIAGATEIRVYRGELGCDRQQVPIASLAGGATSYLDTVADADFPRHYRIEAFAGSAACHSPVSNCESTPMGARVQPHTFDIQESGTVNGIPDPGETVNLPVTLYNWGLDASTSTTGTLTFVDPVQGQVLDGQATWGNVPSGGTTESDAPHFQVEVADTVACGDSVAWNVDATAANSSTTRKTFSVQLGEKDRDFVNGTSETIPDQTASPVVSSFVVPDDEVIGELDVSVSITHDEATELVVELMSPGGTTVRLHDQTAGDGFGVAARYDADRPADGPGTMADFAGESSAGTWTLSIEDLGAVSTNGTLNSWTVHVTSAGAFDCEEAGCTAPPPTMPAAGLTVDKTINGAQLDLDFAWNSVPLADGYRVLQSTDKTFVSGIMQTGATAGATTFTLPDGANTTPSLTFFQVRGVNVCGDEGP